MKVTHRPLKPFTGVRFGERASVEVQTGATFHEIVLDTNIADPAMIAYVEVNLNGDPLYYVSGEHLVMLEKYKSRYVAQGVYVISFSAVDAKLQAGAMHNALVTFGQDSLTIYVTLKSDPNEGTAEALPAPVIKGYAEVSGRQDARVFLPRLKTHNLDASATGEITWDTLVKISDADVFIKRAHFAGDISNLKIERDDIKIFDAPAAINNHWLLRLGRTPQPSYFHFDAVAQGFEAADALSVAHKSAFSFVPTVDTAGNIQVLVESFKYMPQPKAA